MPVFPFSFLQYLLGSHLCMYVKSLHNPVSPIYPAASLRQSSFFSLFWEAIFNIKFFLKLYLLRVHISCSLLQSFLSPFFRLFFRKPSIPVMLSLSLTPPRASLSFLLSSVALKKPFVRPISSSLSSFSCPSLSPLFSLF